jgi:hypothetical protein
MGPELVQRAVAVVAHPEVHLGDVVDAHGPGGIDQQGHVDAVTGHERQAFEQPSAARVLAAQRLGDLGQVGEELREQRPGEELGHATTTHAVGLGAVVVALHEVDVGIGEQRAEEAHHEGRVEVHDVGVDPDDHVAGALVDATSTGLRPCRGPRRGR